MFSPHRQHILEKWASRMLIRQTGQTLTVKAVQIRAVQDQQYTKRMDLLKFGRPVCGKARHHQKRC